VALNCPLKKKIMAQGGWPLLNLFKVGGACPGTKLSVVWYNFFGFKKRSGRLREEKEEEEGAGCIDP
jgi:hypothetical protein